MRDHDIVDRLAGLVGPGLRARFEGDRCVDLDLAEPQFPYYGLLRGVSDGVRREALALVCLLVGLRRLNLRRSVLRTLPDAMGALVNLEELALGSNYLGQVPPWIEGLGRLRVLGLSNCDIRSLPDFLGGLTSLEHLSLHKNLRLRELPEALRSHPSLQWLNLYFVSLREVPEWLFDLPALRSITLWNARVLPEAIVRARGLEYFSCCGSPSLREITPALTRLPRLRMTRLYQNSLESLPESFGDLTGLEQVSLYQNRLTSLPDSMAGLHNLRKLNLGWNSFERLPGWLAQLPSLEWLGAFKNPLVERSPRFAPEVRVDWERPFTTLPAAEMPDGGWAAAIAGNMGTTA